MGSSTVAKLVEYFNVATTMILVIFAVLGVVAVFSKKLRGNVSLSVFCIAALAAFVLEATAFNFPHYLKYFAAPPAGLMEASEIAPNIGLTIDGVQVELIESGIRFSKLNRKVTSIFVDMDFGNIEKAEMSVRCIDEGSTYQYAKSLYKYRPHQNYARLRPRGKVSELTITFNVNAGSSMDVRGIEIRDIVINKPIPYYFSGLRLIVLSLLFSAIFLLVHKNLRAKEVAYRLLAHLKKAKTENQNRLSVIFRYITLGCAFLLVNGLVFLYYQISVNKTDGEYVYPLDDAYIHLSVAKNAALYGNWGVTRYEFTSSSSSPLYTFIISVLIRLFGDNAMYPLLVNILFGNLVIIALYMFIKNKLWFLISVFFLCTPVLLHVQILSGMEHTMHILMILTAFMLFSKFADSGFNDKKYGVPFLCVSALLCMSRYESMFFLCPVLVILLLNKRYVFALLTAAAGFLPVLLFGFWSISKGGFFFPNSLLMKGDIALNGVMSGILYYWGKLSKNIIKSQFFMGTMVMILIVVLQDFVINKTYNFNAFFNLIKKYAFVFIVLTTIFLHTLFASIGWMFRYEAYLLVLLYLALILVVNKNVGYSKGCAIALSMIFIFISVPAIVDRFFDSHRLISQAGKNIYDQHIQMGKFLKTFYNGSNVMANDIGAITYYTDIRLKDLVGLGSNDVLALRKANNMHQIWGREGGWGMDGGWASLISKYKKEYSVIIIYDFWFGIRSKADYERLGLIQIGELWHKDNLVWGGNHVSFCTSDRTMVEKFRDNMLKFKEMAPWGVNVVVF